MVPFLYLFEHKPHAESHIGVHMMTVAARIVTVHHNDRNVAAN